MKRPIREIDSRGSTVGGIIDKALTKLSETRAIKATTKSLRDRQINGRSRV
ncbi:MAG: hypothetical protein WCO45_06415 [Pseudanabaena sp. ELA607]